MKKKSNVMNSLSLLYLLFILMLLQLSYLMYKKDNQSIFVFAIIIFISYLVNSNMIFVLGLSLLSINILVYLRSSVIYEGMSETEQSPQSSSENYEKMDCRDFKLLINKKINDALVDSSGNTIPKYALSFCNKMKNMYIQAETDYEYYDSYIKEHNKISNKQDLDWIDKNIYNSKDSSRLGSPYIICTSENSGKNLPEHIAKGLEESKSNTSISSYNKEHFENNIEEDKSDPNHISNVMNRIQTNTPDLLESLKLLNTLDMKEVNSLINNLNNIAGTFKGSG